MVNAVVYNDMGHLIISTDPRDNNIDTYLRNNGIYELIRPYVNEYFKRDKSGTFTLHYKLNNTNTNNTFIKVGKYMVNMNFSQLR